MIRGFFRVYGDTLSADHIKSGNHFGCKNALLLDYEDRFETSTSLISTCINYKWVLIRKGVLILEDNLDMKIIPYTDNEGYNVAVLCIPEIEFHKKKHKIRNICNNTHLFIFTWNNYNTSYNVYSDEFFKNHVAYSVSNAIVNKHEQLYIHHVENSEEDNVIYEYSLVA